MLGEIKVKGAHHGGLTDFSVVMFVATVAYVVICIAKWGDESALNSLAPICKLPMMELPSLQVISVAVNFHLKVISLQCNLKVQFRLVPYWTRSSPFPTTTIYPTVVVFQSSLFVYVICYMYSLSIQNAIEYKTGNKPLKSGMLIVRFPVGVTDLSVLETSHCTQPPVGTGDAYPGVKASQT